VFDIVVIAASLGGPQAVRTVLAALPAEFPAAVVVVQHRAVGSDAVALELLRRNARLPVRLAEDGACPSPGVVDLAPADRPLVLGAAGSFALREAPDKLGGRADPLLVSVADYYRGRAIGVILSGMLDDGAAGVSALKRRGGWVLAQDRASARAFGMPGAAIATGCVDHVLPLDRVADALVALTMWPGAADLFRVPPPFWAPAAP
jgi:two-component system chemotaxis response regulator CheB